MAAFLYVLLMGGALIFEGLSPMYIGFAVCICKLTSAQ